MRSYQLPRLNTMLRIFSVLLLLCAASGCGKDDELDFAPPVTGGPLSFTIEAKYPATGRYSYALNKFTPYLTKGDHRYSFIIKGKDEVQNAEIIISGAAPAPGNTGSSDFNIAINGPGSQTVYKDDNWAEISVKEGTDSKGKFTRFTFKSQSLITATLKGDRFSAEPYYYFQCTPITIYSQE